MTIRKNWGIPFFEGMQSVKMPVLTTRGKNLFDGGLTTGFLNESTGEFQTSLSNEITNYITVEPNAYLSVHFNGVRHGRIFEYDINKNYIKCSAQSTTTGVALNEKTRFVRVRLPLEVERELLQIEQNDKITSYEPYKSNILTVNEDVELGSVGEVKDELNLTTGELTQRVGEIVLDGSENWQIREFNEINTECAIFTINIDDKLNSWYFNCDKFKYNNIDVISANNIEGIYSGGKPNSFFINVSKTKASTVEEFKNWLSNNNVKVQYCCQESIKTVDLSDNHVYSYKDTTHYACSSEDGSLVPTLSVKVPTDTQLTIQEQKATTQTLLIKNMDLQQSIKEVQAMNLAFNTALYNSFNSIREEVEDIKKHVSTNENLEGSF